MDKPLPDLPESKTLRGLKHVPPNANWATLSVDGREHLHRFILHALEEAKDTLPEDEWEEWAVGVEHALAELGERISLGGWLVGLRRMRMCRMQEMMEHNMAKKIQSSDAGTSRRDDGGSPRGKGAQAQSAQDEPGFFTLGRHSGKGTGQSPQPTGLSLRESLQNLRTQAALNSAPGPKPTAKHLLLTVAPPGRMPVVQQSDTEEYEFPRSRFSCTFFPGVFAMPQAIDSEEDEYGNILYGLDTWGCE
jgi:1-phosphatidylinositol-3-phosphate 5-kinase